MDDIFFTIQAFGGNEATFMLTLGLGLSIVAGLSRRVRGTPWNVSRGHARRLAR